jgi:hypothetical protein
MRRVSLGALFTPPLSLSSGFVKLGDIDGDGKADYVYFGDVIPTGKVTAWRNGGVGVPTFWQSLGVIFEDQRLGIDVDWRLVCIYSIKVALG